MDCQMLPCVDGYTANRAHPQPAGLEEFLCPSSADDLLGAPASDRRTLRL